MRQVWMTMICRSNMTGFELLMSCVGMILCALIFLACCIVAWGIFKWLMSQDEGEQVGFDNSEYDWGHDVNYRQEDEE